MTNSESDCNKVNDSQFIFSYQMILNCLFLNFQEFHHTGSYYDGLRLSIADEFDLNLVMNIRELKPILRVIEELISFKII
jgi:hypothetical protein